ncbi:MAG: citrate/2-methylcitrate synthase, partial [Bacteroidia bacterium]
MDSLKEKFIEKARPMAAEVKAIIKEHGDVKLGEYTIAQVYQGMKGITGLVTETSKLDAEEGIRFRGYTIPELRAQLPKAPNGTEPLPEGIFHLMLVGELPTADEAYNISNNWAR